MPPKKKDIKAAKADKKDQSPAPVSGRASRSQSATPVVSDSKDKKSKAEKKNEVKSVPEPQSKEPAKGRRGQKADPTPAPDSSANSKKKGKEEKAKIESKPTAADDDDK